MNHSLNYNKVKKWYDSGRWNKEMVHNAVVEGWITAEEYKEITGDPYVV